MTIIEKITLDKVNEILSKKINLNETELTFLVVMLGTKCLNITQKQRDWIHDLSRRIPKR